MKQKYWEQLVDGYNKIDDLKKQCLDLSKKIIEFKAKFKHFINQYGESLNQKENIIIFKLKSIIACLIYNDYQKCHVNEQSIEDLKKKEKTYLKNMISSCTIINGESVMITSSLLNQQNNIKLKLGYKHSLFFNYKEDEIQNISRIEQLMPKMYANNHKSFISKFLRKVD